MCLHADITAGQKITILFLQKLVQLHNSKVFETLDTPLVCCARSFCIKKKKNKLRQYNILQLHVHQRLFRHGPKSVQGACVAHIHPTAFTSSVV